MSLDTIVRLRTYAKVNLFLRVVGRRGDGFHEVETILHGVGLYDEIEIQSSPEDLRVTMELSEGISGPLPSSEDNLISQVAAHLSDRLDGGRGAIVHVKKGIPIASGLGGGSANAAGALVALAEVWGLELDRDGLFSIAEELGSDVPYCIEGGTVFATARGEKLTPLPGVAPMWFVLGGTNRPLFTREVYELWDSMAPSEGFSPLPVTMALGAGDAAEVAALLHNDLEVPAFSLAPELEAKKASLIEAGALGAGMSGSGPTMFAIAETESHAASIAAGVADRFDWVKVVQSQNACIERLN